MIQFSSVAKRYPGGHEALRGVSFAVAQGEMVAVTGHSGAGKSTLLKLAAGIERASSGTVLVNGQNLAALGETALAVLRRRIGFVFQDHKLLFDRNAFENVALPLRLAGGRQADYAGDVEEMLDWVGLGDRMDDRPASLSGGEKQRLAIARAVVSKPELILADEPTGSVDAAMGERLLKLFQSLNRLGTTVLIASHDEALAARSGASVLRLEGGRLSGGAA